MKALKAVGSFLLVTVALGANVNAQSPREQLAQMVAQLQKTPADIALREKIIRLASEIRPAPAVPAEAERREGRAKFAFKTARSNDDYLSAAREYEEAVRVAPWIAGYYLDLCTIYEKAERYVEAKRNCQFALFGLTEPAQTSETRQRIAGLEFGIEKANSPQVREATLLQTTEGARFIDVSNKAPRPYASYESIYELRQQVLHFKIRLHSLGEGNRRMNSFRDQTTPGEYSIASIPYRNGEFTLSEYGDTFVFTIRPDGQALIKRYATGNNAGRTEIIPRQ